MATVNCLCQIYPHENTSWLRVERKRLGGKNSNMPREDTIYVYAPILIGMCKVFFKNDNNDTNGGGGGRTPINYHGMETEKFYYESRVAQCGRWIVWNNKEKQFNRDIDYNGYWIFLLFI